MEKGFLITKNHFDIEEVNYPQLKKFTNNVILEHINNSGSELFYFKRSLYELDRLGYNIGILLNTDNILSEEQLLNNLIWNIRGFKINLGIWIKGTCTEDFYNILKNDYQNNFISGIISDNDYINAPRWGINGDIEEIGSINLDFIRCPIIELSLNTDYRTIYDENKLKPLPSTY